MVETKNDDKIREIRCRKSRRLLMKGRVVRVVIKCPKCKHVQVIEGHSLPVPYFFQAEATMLKK